MLCDDITQKPGHIRIRKSGSAGGHNGLKSVIGFCGEGFPRIRMGVGEKPTPEYDLADWVLGMFPKEQGEALETAFSNAAAAAKLIAAGKTGQAMNKFN